MKTHVAYDFRAATDKVFVVVVVFSVDILNNDTIYLRFASLGKICDPWAMSTSELRVELKARNAYEINLQPEQLVGV